MNVTHILMVLMGISLTVIVAFFVAGVAFAIARWGESPVPESVATSGKAFAMALMVISTVLALVLAIFK
ncbi:hypothetical protein ACFC3O_29310 [Streptomyces sp. NPDC056007]|uniref:hypothetical protein n=1 Tax=Streptomyces sp. NPDC056007 TaxID=3345678 RepID=UPI0017BC3DC0|nr:hypothetical protein [Streptomyces sp. SJ1-7]